MAGRINFTESFYQENKRPAWMADYANREHVIAGGAKLDAAQFPADAQGRRFVTSGTPIGRTTIERDAGAGFGPAAATDDEFFLLNADVVDANKNNDCDLYRHDGLVKENFLPGFATMAADIKAKIKSLYQCTIGVD